MKTFRSLRENQLDEISRDTTLSYAKKAHAKYDTLRNKKDSESTAKKARLASGIKKANLRINPQLKDKPPQQNHHIDMSSPKAYYASKSAAGQHYVGDSVELEGDELFEGHYEDADEHMSNANDAHSRGDMVAYHSHMADHHDSMSQWHEEKGRGFHADKHSEKAEMHADKMHDAAHGRMTEAKSAEIRMYNALQKARQDREKADAEKERLRKGGEELLNPVKKPAPLEPVKEGLFDFLSNPSAEKKKPKLDYNAIRQSAQVRSKSKPKVFNGPEEYNRAKAHNFAEETELEEGTFKYHMDKAIAADERGDTKKRAQHLENARTAKFAMKTSDYAKNRELLDKHKQMSMSEEVELEEAAKGHTIEAHGIRGMKSTPWRKTFKSHEHLAKWADANDSVEVHGTRDLEQAKKGNLSPAVKEGYNDIGRAYGGAGSGRSADSMETAKLTRHAKAAAKKAGVTFNTSAEYRGWHAKQKPKKSIKEEIVHTRTGADGTKYHIKQDSPTDFSVHREDNGKLKHIDTYGSLHRAKQVLDNEVKEAVEQIDEISRTTAMNYVRANQEDDAKKMNDPTKRKNPTFTTTVVGKHNKGVSKNTIGFSNAMARISGHKPTTPKKTTSEEVLTEEKPGLYDNIHAKQRRIKNGSGEHMRKPGSKGTQTAKDFREAQKTVKQKIDTRNEEGLARLISKSIKNVAAVKPTPQQKADIRLNHLNK